MKILTVTLCLVIIHRFWIRGWSWMKKQMKWLYLVTIRVEQRTIHIVIRYLITTFLAYCEYIFSVIMYRYMHYLITTFKHAVSIFGFIICFVHYETFRGSRIFRNLHIESYSRMTCWEQYELIAQRLRTAVSDYTTR